LKTQATTNKVSSLWFTFIVI